FSYHVILTLAPGWLFSRFLAASSRNATFAGSSASWLQTSNVTSWALAAVTQPNRTANVTVLTAAMDRIAKHACIGWFLLYSRRPGSPAALDSYLLRFFAIDWN